MESLSSELRQTFSLGKFEDLSKQVSRLLKNYNSYSEEDQCILIATLISLNNPIKALMLLEKECKQGPLATTPTQCYLKKRVMYAQLKIAFQSNRMGYLLFKDVISSIEANRHIISDDVLKSLLTQVATNLRLIDEYKIVQELENIYPKTDQESVTDCLFNLELMRAKVTTQNNLHLDDLLEINRMLDKFQDHKTFCIILKLHLLDLKILFGQLSRNEALEIEKNLQINQVPPAFLAYYFYLIGVAKFQINCKEDASLFLNKALVQCADSVILKQTISYWLVKCDPDKEYPLVDYILLACGKTQSIESYLWGNRFIMKTVPLPPQYKDELFENPSEDQCWIIKKGKVYGINYQDLANSNDTLDLHAGILFGKNKVVLLTDLRVKLLSLVISTGRSGAHRLYLIDELFGDGFYYYNSAALRLKNLIVELTKIGIRIKRENNYYFYDFEKNPNTIIFPTNHHCRGPISYLKKIQTSVSRKDIEAILMVKPSTASLYLKKWKEEGIVKNNEHLGAGEYFFNL